MKDKEKQLVNEIKQDFAKHEEKHKQIEEMAKIMQRCYEKKGLLNFKWFAESAYKCLTEDSVVLSREEYQKDFSSQFNKGYKQGSKETAEKFYNFVRYSGRSQIVYENGKEKSFLLVNREELNNFVKQFAVETVIDDNCEYYDKVNMRCGGAKCTPSCYCNGHKSECTEYPETRKKFSVEIKE